MFDDLPEDHHAHLQEVGQALMNGTLDKTGAVIRLVRQGWDHEEAHAAVAEVAEQIETTKKLLRDAARVLDDSPLGQARAAARLQEMGLSGPASHQIVRHYLEQRHEAAGRLRDVLRRIRLGLLGRTHAVGLLTDRGMEPIIASTLVDVFTDSAFYWGKEWLTLCTVLAAGALATTGVIVGFAPRELLGWLGAALGVFVVALPLLVLAWSWKNWRFWQRWTVANLHARECPRSCSPMVMLAEGRGRTAALVTLTEWGLSRDAATELVHRRARLNSKAYLWIGAIGVLFVTIAFGTSWFSLAHDDRLLPVTLVSGVMSAVGGALLYRGLRGWRRFRRA